MIFSIALNTADPDGACPPCPLANPFTDYQVRQKQQIKQEKGYHDSDAPDPLCFRIFSDQTVNGFVDQASSLPFSSVNKFKVGGISIPRIDVFSSLLTATPFFERTTLLAVRNVHHGPTNSQRALHNRFE